MSATPSSQDVKSMFATVGLSICDDGAAISEGVAAKKDQYEKARSASDERLQKRASAWFQVVEMLRNQRPRLLDIVYQQFMTEAEQHLSAENGAIDRSNGLAPELRTQLGRLAIKSCGVDKPLAVQFIKRFEIELRKPAEPSGRSIGSMKSTADPETPNSVDQPAATAGVMILIPCPECGRELKLRDRKLLGRTGRCPNCQHSFVLTEPEEVELELASDVSPATSPVVGTAAQWVPDSNPSPVTQTPQTPFNLDASSTSTATATVATAPAPATGIPFPNLESKKTSQGASSAIQDLKRRNAKRRKRTIITVSILAVVAMGGWFLMDYFGNFDFGEPKVAENNEETVVPEKVEKSAVPDTVVDSPTIGEPIKLLFVPSGARIIINIRPAELWAEDSLGEEFRFCLSDLGVWGEEQIKQICHFRPQEIEEALICIIPGQIGEPPAVSAVIRLVGQFDKPAMIYTKQRNMDFGYPVYMDDKIAFLLRKDLKTIAYCPSELASEMVDALVTPNATSSGIEQLLRHTDRNRHFTILFDPIDVRSQQMTLVPEDLRPFLNLFLDWFNDEEVESIAWSMHLQENEFQSEFLLRNRTIVRERRLSKGLKKKLDVLPEDILGMVRYMSPQTVGFRKIIGRFPAMMKVFQLSTTFTDGNRYVKMLTSIKTGRAAPNLAAGIALTWNETLRTDFTGPVKVVQRQRLPDKVIDRLKMKIEIEFSNEPLHGTFTYIGQETKVVIEIDGAAFKEAGMTKNMAQNQVLGVVPAIDGIKAIVDRYKNEGMCIVIDESKKKVIITTLKSAKNNNQTPYQF